MYDFIETIALRDQAEEELYFEAVEDKLKNKPTLATAKPTKVQVYIDDKHHKFYFKPH